MSKTSHQNLLTAGTNAQRGDAVGTRSLPTQYARGKQDQLSFIPTGREERIFSLDVLRGFALLGILLLNINSFGSVELAHDIPSLQDLYGPHGHINFAILLFKWVFFEGKARGIFSMLFGAGVILLTSRAERRGAAAGVADIFTRRNLLLMLFGFLHGVFIWAGDILFDYGLAALLFLYPARRLSARFLIFAGVLLSLSLGTLGVLQVFHSLDDLTLSGESVRVEQRQAMRLPISAKDQKTLRHWQETVDKHTLTEEKIARKIANSREGYWKQVQENLPLYFGDMATLHIYLLPETVSAMLLGMGLYKIGFLKAESGDFTYAVTALGGLIVSLPLYLYGFSRAYESHFNFLLLDQFVWIPYELTRTAGMVAIAAMIMLIVKHGIFQAVQRGLAAVGKTAFSNYIGTSILCQLIFVWGPWKGFGLLHYYQLMYVVVGVWVANITLSMFWLRHFEFGPLEWVWRSLTYLKVQPICRSNIQL